MKPPKCLKPLHCRSLVRGVEKFLTVSFMVAVLACNASVLSGARVPFDLAAFKPILSESRLHAPSTSPATVSAGRFDRYSLAGRFYVGEGGSTMVLATARSGRDRSELRHNSSWPVGNARKHYSARMRFDRPTTMEGRARLHVLQIYTTGATKGPMVLITWMPDFRGRQDRITAYVRGDGSYDLGSRPNGFFNLDVGINAGKLRIYFDNQLKVEADVSAYASSSAFFKTGAYQRGIEPHAVEFEALSIIDGVHSPRGAVTSGPSTAATIVRSEATRGTPYSTIIGDDAEDPYYKRLTFERVSGPGWLTIAPNGEISGTPFSRDVGLNSFEVKVTNHEGKSVNITLQISVE